MIASENFIVLQMQPVGSFYSPCDEAALFEWFDKIKCIKKYEGRGDTLYIYINPSEVGEDELSELLAVFFRYEINMKQLLVFDKDEFKSWFKNKDAYWYEAVFG